MNSDNKSVSPDADKRLSAQAVSNEENSFITAPVGGVVLKTALPIIIVMLVNGAYNLADAWFLGKYVGADALAAVTLMFPLQMFLLALATAVSTGLASVLARRLGAGDRTRGYAAYSAALALSVAIPAVIISLFLAFGDQFVLSLAGGDAAMADMAKAYMTIFVTAVPLLFVLSSNLDVLRTEGKASQMALITIVSTLLNIVFNYLLIVEARMGVEGAAIGTVASQVVSLLLTFKVFSKMPYRPRAASVGWSHLMADCSEIIGLGLPYSLNFIGVSLVAIAAVYGLQNWPPVNYEATIGAYGITTRLTTFMVLPLIGLTMALQTVVGHNHGAGRDDRVKKAVWLVVLGALGYCLTVEGIFIAGNESMGHLFVDDAPIIAETARLLPVMVLCFFLAGPNMVFAQYFQAIGAKGNAALLNLSRTYIFLLPLMFLLPLYWGEPGLWIARPVAEIGVTLVTMWVLLSRSGRKLIRRAEASR